MLSNCWILCFCILCKTRKNFCSCLFLFFCWSAHGESWSKIWKLVQFVYTIRLHPLIHRIWWWNCAKSGRSEILVSQIFLCLLCFDSFTFRADNLRDDNFVDAGGSFLLVLLGILAGPKLRRDDNFVDAGGSFLLALLGILAGPKS